MSARTHFNRQIYSYLTKFTYLQISTHVVVALVTQHGATAAVMAIVLYLSFC